MRTSSAVEVYAANSAEKHCNCTQPKAESKSDAPKFRLQAAAKGRNSNPSSSGQQVQLERPDRSTFELRQFANRVLQRIPRITSGGLSGHRKLSLVVSQVTKARSLGRKLHRATKSMVAVSQVATHSLSLNPMVLRLWNCRNV